MKEKLKIKYDKKFYSYIPFEEYLSTQIKKIFFIFRNEFHKNSANDFLLEQFLSDLYYIIHDKKNKITFIGDCEGDDWIDFADDPLKHASKNKACIVSLHNFETFIKEWENLIQQTPPFALIYRDDNDWVHLKQFNSEKKMNLFIKQHSSILQQIKFWMQLKKKQWKWKFDEIMYRFKNFIRK